MDGFRIDTTAMEELSLQYSAVGRALIDNLDELRRITGVLRTQTIGQKLPELISAVTTSLEEASRDTEELGSQCREIAAAYLHTEKQVASLVAGLTSALPFTVQSAEHGENTFMSAPVSVNSQYHLMQSIFLSGNRLPCESWLLERTIRANMDGGSL